MTVVTYVLWFGSAALLAIALMLTTFRLVAGPGTLDRLVSLDTLAAIGQCALALYIAWTRDTTPAAAVMAMALISFIGSVSVARFRVPDDCGAGAAAHAVTVEGAEAGGRTIEEPGPEPTNVSEEPKDPAAVLDAAPGSGSGATGPGTTTDTTSEEDR